MRNLALAILVGLVVHGTASAQLQFAMPTDADLKTAYCITVIQRQVHMLDVDVAKMGPNDRAYDIIRKARDEAATRLNRLQSYFLPRMYTLDPLGVGMAIKRADNDWEQTVAQAGICETRCTGSGKTFQETVACIQTCGHEIEAPTRMERCQKLEWLPF